MNEFTPPSPLYSKPKAPSNISAHSVGVSLRHVSPRKFQQLQQEQRAAAIRNMPLSPLSLQRPSPLVNTTARGNSKQDSQRNAPTSTSACKNPVMLCANNDPDPDSPTPTIMMVLAAAGIFAPPSESSPSQSATPVGYGTTSFEQWLQNYEQDMLHFESLEKFFQVKIPEALAFGEKLQDKAADNEHRGTLGATRFPERLRIALFAHVLESTVFALMRSASLGHAKNTLFLVRQELMRAIFADYDCLDDGSNAISTCRSRKRRTSAASGDQQPSGDSNSSGSDEENGDKRSGCRFQEQKCLPNFPNTPNTLEFFLTKTPFALKLQQDSQCRAVRFKQHQVVLRRIIHSMYQSLGSVFHAWHRFAQQRRENRLNQKGAQVTALIVLQRGLIRSVFVEWSKCALLSKIRALETRETQIKKQHEQVLADLREEIFLLREKNQSLVNTYSEEEYDLSGKQTLADDF